MNLSPSDRVRGCLLGGAIGDAFGSAYEGRSSPIVVDDDQPWFITDDTQMTLATCEAITAAGKVCPEAIADRFTEWFRHKRLRGVGASTYKALSELAMGGHWALVGRTGEMAAGNGAAMRIAPLAFCCDPFDLDERVVIRDVCRITHHNDEAYAGALAIAMAIRLVYQGEGIGPISLIPAIAEALPDSRVRDCLQEIKGTVGEQSIRELAQRFGTSGHAAESVPIALGGAEIATKVGFAEAIHQLVSVGGDTDTIASMAGQVAGCRIGLAELPIQMIDRLPNREEIDRITDNFVRGILE